MQLESARAYTGYGGSVDVLGVGGGRGLPHGWSSTRINDLKATLTAFGTQVLRPTQSSIEIV
jgi:hypothetical protein